MITNINKKIRGKKMESVIKKDIKNAIRENSESVMHFLEDQHGNKIAILKSVFNFYYNCSYIIAIFKGEMLFDGNSIKWKNIKLISFKFYSKKLEVSQDIKKLIGQPIGG